jgi:hypothetical protein
LASRRTKPAFHLLIAAQSDPLEVFQENNPIFNGLVTLDSMWAVSDRGGYPLSTTKDSTKKK